MFTKYLGQYQVGETWVSRGRTITEADIVNFAGFSGDWFSLHTDKEYAAKTSFKKRIAHGMLVLSVASGLTRFDPGVVVAFYGIDHLRFTRPTFIGDTVHVQLTVKAIDKKENGTGVVTVYQEVKKQTGQTVIIAELKILVNGSQDIPT